MLSKVVGLRFSVFVLDNMECAQQLQFEFRVA